MDLHFSDNKLIKITKEFTIVQSKPSKSKGLDRSDSANLTKPVASCNNKDTQNSSTRAKGLDEKSVKGTGIAAARKPKEHGMKTESDMDRTVLSNQKENNYNKNDGSGNDEDG
ncbi:Ff.00g064950.m01.CDS01 [Fusarium sp. VM40]|nr:Ff.00g064950.m01.CDS01 [Fusarium sp. VM40]